MLHSPSSCCKSCLRIEPPHFSLPCNQPQPQHFKLQNLNAPKNFKHIFVLTRSHHNLHNKIVNHISQNNLKKLTFILTIDLFQLQTHLFFIMNAVLNDQFQRSKYTDLLLLHQINHYLTRSRSCIERTLHYR